MTSELTPADQSTDQPTDQPTDQSAEQRGILARVKSGANTLIRKHGPEVGAVVKIAAHALIPGAPLLVNAVEAACDYVADKGRDLNQHESDAAMMQILEELGGDVAHLESLLNHLAGQLDGVIGQMVHLAQFDTPPEALESMVNMALETQLSELRDEFRALTPELETVRRQGEQMLEKQALQGDMLRQILELLSAALAFNAPLASEGLTGPQVSLFLGARGGFQSALLSGDLEGAARHLGAMKRISPNGNTYRINAMALQAAQRDFAAAERTAQKISSASASDPRVRRAITSITHITRGLTRGIARGAAQETTKTPVNIRYEVGSKVGDRGWELSALLGRGSMGSVWRARNRFGREGAIKLMSVGLSADSGFISRFESEIRALDQVNHSAVINILDWGQDQSGAWYFVMPFIEGRSLRSRLLERGQLSSDEVRSIARDLAAGLVACHARGVIHRDIKPENIMLNASGAPILIDFGIAHQESVSTGQTYLISRSGTPPYAPPEQLAGHVINATADLHALGVTLEECLGSDAMDEAWDTLINQMTHRHPPRRGTAQALLERLNEAPKRYHVGLQGEPTQGPFSVDEVVHRVLAGADELSLWWPGESTWRVWSAVDEVRTQVEAMRRFTPPPMQPQDTPPPMLKSQRSAGDVVTSNVEGVEFRMVYCPAGEFGMGADDTIQWVYKGKQHQKTNHRPRHQVRITQPVLLGQTPVTQELWEVIMGSNPSAFKGRDLPVESVSWFDCVRFCNELSHVNGLEPAYHIKAGKEPMVQVHFDRAGYRLPTEAEWEYASRAGLDTMYAGGDILGAVAWYGYGCDGGSFPKDSQRTVTRRGTVAVAQKRSNAWGLYDMSGNVWEWCNDTWNESAYQGRTSPTLDPHEWAESKALQTIRGGSWNIVADRCRVVSRSKAHADYRGNYLGLRILRRAP